MQRLTRNGNQQHRQQKATTYNKIERPDGNNRITIHEPAAQRQMIWTKDEGDEEERGMDERERRESSEKMVHRMTSEAVVVGVG